MSIFEFDEEKFKKAEREAGREAGIEEGIVLGMNNLRLLIQKMAEAGEADLLVRLADKTFLEQMCQKYQV